MQVKKFAGGGLARYFGRNNPIGRTAIDAFGMSQTSPRGALGIVKPKGGNWLNNSVEDALEGLKTEMRPPVPGAVRGPIEPYNNGVSERVRWLSPEGHTIEVQEGPAGHFGRQDSMDSWIEGPLTKYVKTRMASPEDEVRRLADQGVLHIDQDSLRNAIRPVQTVLRDRVAAGFPEGGMSPLKPGERTAGYDWENASDSFISQTDAGRFASTQTVGGKNPGPTYLRDNPWLATIPPETPVYDFAMRSTGSPQLAPSLGFDHLVDELSNALTPNSGLPRHLQLTPEAVKNLSMEKAVRRVADINAWRAAQKIEASQKIAGGPGQELVREYAHTPEKPNPKGLRWVELKKSEEWHPEGWKGEPLDELRQQYLADQLKYEGDTMGHCVGGYCDDVVAGRSRIFSLRGANGEPHVTVEVEPGRQALNEMDAEGNLTMPPKVGLPKITQIKGKQNRKPKDEYLPFVQDFVKNPPHGAPWGEVGDLQNSGLKNVQMSEFGITGYMTQPELEAALKAAGVPEPNISGHVYGQGFASGGSVSATLGGWEALTDPTGSPAENKLSWDIFSGHNDAEQLEAQV